MLSKLERCLLWAVAFGVLFAAPATASIITITGADEDSQYVGAGTGDPLAGLMTFTLDGDDSGFVSAVDGAGDLTGTGFDPANISATEVRAWFSVELGPNQNPSPGNGGPFDPATDNVNKARFLGNGADFSIFTVVDPLTPGGSNTPDEMLLIFDIDFVDVTASTKAQGLFDTDGSVSLGDPTETATSSSLTLVGGTMAAAFGGVGSSARLSVTYASLSNPILKGGDRNGYLNDDFTSGISVPGQAPTWTLTIIPIPEPGTASLLGLSLLVITGLARRQSSRH